MKVIIVGCEYAGTTTLAHQVHQWHHQVMDKGMILFHDHWKIPFTSGHQEWDPLLALNEEEEEQVLALSPKLKEMHQRHSLWYHTSFEALTGADHMVVGLHIEDGIYGPLYFNYGEEDAITGDRRIISNYIEANILEHAPEMVLVLVKASADVIRKRMKEAPHRHQVLREADVEHVSQRFEEEFERSTIRSKFTLDTTTATVEESLGQFVQQIEPYLTESDRTRMLVKKAMQRGDWP